MGLRLGYRIVKIWRWIKLSAKSRSYAPLRRLNSRKSVRLRIGGKLCRRWVNSQALLNSSDFFEYSHGAPARQIRQPHLELQWLNLLRWQSYLPQLSQGYKKGLDICENRCSKQIPKGYLAVEVGEGAEHERYVIPVVYCNHPLFRELLKEAEEENGFNHRGPITIPCKLAHFHSVQKLIQTHQARSY